MPKFKIYWGLDGSTDGEEIIDADDQAEAQAESFVRLHEMLTERGFHRAEPITD
jgi:hypothetical protein